MNINWHDITFCIDRLVESIKKTNAVPEAIIGIGRGGLIPATLLAYKLDVNKVYNFSVQSYSADNKQLQQFTTVQEPGDDIKQFSDKNVIVVDDLADSGNTFAYIKERLAELHGLHDVKTAAICIKEHTAHIPDFFVTVYPKSEWIIFPWD